MGSKPSTRIPDDPLRTQEFSAEYLDVTTRTIRSYVSKGYLPAVRIKGSRAIRIRQSDLDALLQPIPSAAG